MTEAHMHSVMYAVVSLATKDLDDLELAVLNNVAQTDGDPRVTIGSEKYLHLFDSVFPDGKPRMAEETKRALASVVLKRLSGS
jgi:hypothetical protein